MIATRHVCLSKVLLPPMFGPLSSSIRGAALLLVLVLTLLLFVSTSIASLLLAPVVVSVAVIVVVGPSAVSLGMNSPPYCSKTTATIKISYTTV
jgi:hypothetical protein